MTDPQKMITEIGGRGYATGPTYPTSIMRVINQYDLTKYDKIAMIADYLEAKYDCLVAQSIKK